MTRRKRQSSTFNLSFLDIMSCGFGAVVLVFLTIDRSIQVEIQEVNAEVLSEIDLMEEVIDDGKAELVALRNAIEKAELDISEASGLARRLTQDIDDYEAEIAVIVEADVSNEDALDKLKAKKNRLEDEIKQLNEAAQAQAGRSARSFQGEGNRQYLTGLNLGGRRTVILVDASASMLANQLVNVMRLRNMEPELKKQAAKWSRTLDTVDWLFAQLPVDSQFQVITFNTEAQAALEGTEGQWLELADSPKIEAVRRSLREKIPTDGTSLHNAFSSLRKFDQAPDNIILITDGLPTQGTSRPRENYISPSERRELFREARTLSLPPGVPVNIILMPMDGDTEAAWEFWRLAVETQGSLLAPSADWP